MVALFLIATSASGGSAQEKPTKSPTQKTSVQPTVKSPESSTPSSPPAQGKSSVAKRFETGKTRYVHVNRGIVRSGPADSFYATAYLPPNGRVEVYLETSDGWSGIRPPDGSHNWLPATAAYLLPGGATAEVVEEGAPAWVGTDLKQPPKMLWQTGLQKSQVVQVLGEESQQSEKGASTLWYRIAPPQGEFRWIKTSQLSDEPTQVTEPQERASEKESVELASHARAPSPKPASPDQEKHPTSAAVSQAAHSAGLATLASTEGEEGEIVWSDEAEVLSRINQQIRAEQGELTRGLPGGGTTVMHSGEIPVENGFESDAYYEGEPHFEDATSVEVAMTPEELKRAKRHQSARHQVDSLMHWDALEATADPKLRVRPLASVLGVIGLGVIEADRKPINDQIAQERNEFREGGLRYDKSMPHIGPYGSSRLDRLPRPGRAPRITSPTSQPFHDHLGQSEQIPLDPNRPVLTRLWSSNQPLFGMEQPVPSAGGNQPDWLPRDPNHYENVASRGGPFSSAPVHQPTPQPMPSQVAQFHTESIPPSSWHGIQTPSAMLTSHAMQEAFADPLHEAEFETPEIQAAMLELTRIVASPTEAWNLAPLRNACHQWVEAGGTSLVRGEARLLLDRIDRFDSLRTRTLGSGQDMSRIASAPPATPASSGPPFNAPPPNLTIPPSLSIASQAFATNTAPNTGTNGYGVANGAMIASGGGGMPGNPVHPASATGPSIPAPPVDTSVGDASGWLVQVHGKVPGQPEYALTDDHGNVVAYVQTTAALNIRRYLQQPVIVYGQRGYIPSLAARQISVERISRLR